MLKAYKYRLYPNVEQSNMIDQTFGVCRLVYNLGIEIKTRAYREHGVIVSTPSLQGQIKEIREEYPWIKSVSREALDFSLRSMDTAFNNFFKGAGYPRFKRKHGKQSYGVKGREIRIDFDKGIISVPKIKGIPIRISRRFEGEIRTTTVSRTHTRKYFVSILVDDGLTVPQNQGGDPIGIDLGLSSFVVTSNGDKTPNPKFLRDNLRKLGVLQKRVSRKKKGGKNRTKAIKKLALLHERISNQRSDFLHKISSKLVYNNQVSSICIENLAVANMIKNRSLSLSIADASWSEFVRQLEYKSLCAGKMLVKVDRFFASSKICSSCGVKQIRMPLSIRTWTCSCGVTHDRDVNAAINIRNSGMGSPVEPVEQSAMKGCNEAGINVKS